ncbi:MAG: GMC oxidoreductase, partial [Caulobacterales bacterium]|nr:GMC oxidoreductase [Caulobacterales bacterium]
QKGYSVLVLEKGRRFAGEDFSEGTTRPGQWLWNPKFGLRGIMKLTFLRHVAVMSGVGVGGGSLVYGATLPTPKDAYFRSGSWAGLRDWKNALAEHYQTALSMLGAVQNPRLAAADHALRDLARDVGREDAFEPTRVGIFFGDPEKAGQPTQDPFFNGEGPVRRGCIQCGDCMTGCRYDAKNSLDKNYLYLAERLGVRIAPESEVTDVRPTGAADGEEGYFVRVRPRRGERYVVRARGIVFAGGVMGTVPLLLKLRAGGSLPRLSDRVGKDVRTNNESITAVAATDNDTNFSDGVTIGSILNTDENSHLEPVRLGPKSGLWRLMLAPLATGRSFLARMASLVGGIVKDPINLSRAIFARDFGGRTLTLLYMQHLDSTVTLRLGRFGELTSKVEAGQTPPSADMPEANDLTRRMERIIGGKALRMASEVFTGAAATAHVLGGAVIGKDAEHGVIDADNRVFNYANMYVCDGSAISANPGVNPSLSITALTEHAMSQVPAKATPDVTALLPHVTASDVRISATGAKQLTFREEQRTGVV